MWIYVLAVAAVWLLTRSSSISISGAVSTAPVLSTTEPIPIYEEPTTEQLILPPPASTLPAAILGVSGPIQPPSIAWPPLPGQWGFVTIGGKPAPASFSLGDIHAAMTIAGVSGAIVGSIAAIGSVGTFGTSAASVAIGGALPIIGAGIAVAGIVLGIIAKHHMAAIAAEAAGLNAATPMVRQRQVLIAQAAILGEINYTQACNLVQQMISDFYVMVKPIERGHWPWNPSYNDSSAGFWPQGMDQKSPNAHAPDPCNAACWYGHFLAEGDSYTVLLPTIQKILTGQHGVLSLPTVPAKSAEVGFPEVDVIY
jgi:hypothetical protein